MKFPFVNKRIFVLLLSILSVSFISFGQDRVPRHLSDNASISILTCSAGIELYSVFGHTAIRVSDPENEMDLVFNYGTFDFNTPFFYLKFGHGNLDYLLSVSTFKRFMREYFMDSRSVWEQKLHLTGQQKERLFAALILNAQPENRAYEYDFFYDNCATRVADIILDHYNEKSIEFEKNNLSSEQLTFREAIHPYLDSKPWTKLGIDLILGAPADARTDSVSIMFLPDHLMAQFSGIHLSSKDISRGIVSETSVLLDFTEEKPESTNWFSPLVTFWLLFIIVTFLSAAEAYGTISLKLVDTVLFIIIGLLGILIFYLSWISNHQVTSPNWNFLWANPLWLLMVTNVNEKINRVARFIEVTSIIIFVILAFTNIQFIPYDVFPIILILLVRSIRPFRWWLSENNSSSVQ